MQSKSKIRSSILNAVTALLYITVNGLLGLVFTRCVIKYFGSDFNGINSASFQLVNILMILEGGFTLATNVALFGPLGKNEQQKINGILSATDKRFKKIGVLFLCLGIVSTLLYSLLISTEVSYWVVVYIFLMSLLPPAVNIYISLKYRAILLSDQKEYIVSLFTLITVTLGYVLTIVAIQGGCGFWSIKLFITTFSIINSIAIAIYCKKRYKFLDFKVEPDYESIKGTRDVFVGKIAGALYTALPILVIAIAFPNGAKLASVYAVYASVFSFISNAIQSFSSAPRFAFGQLWAEGELEAAKLMFQKYELIVFAFLTILMSTTLSLILPFVNLYVGDVTDIQYQNPLIAILIGCATFVSIVHIPSGHMINMSGNFKLSKKINLAVTISFLFFLIIAVVVSKWKGFDIYGILVATLCAALVLAGAEIIAAHRKILYLSIRRTMILLVPNLAVFILSFVVGLRMPDMDNYLTFFLYGSLALIAFSLLMLLCNYLMNRQITKETINMIIKTVKK